jgi:hypothetical protein
MGSIEDFFSIANLINLAIGMPSYGFVKLFENKDNSEYG